MAGNLKVAVSILVSWLLFQNPMSLLNVLGCAITVAGCTVYGYVTHLVKVRASETRLLNAACLVNRIGTERVKLVLAPCRISGVGYLYAHRPGLAGK